MGLGFNGSGLKGLGFLAFGRFKLQGLSSKPMVCSVKYVTFTFHLRFLQSERL